MKNIIIAFIFIFSNKVLLAQNDTLQTNNVYKEFKYKNGNISSEGYLKENMPTGLWKSYYITGIKKSEGKWSNNKLDSIWIFYDQLGDTIEKINYYIGKKNGHHYRYYKTDKNKNKILSKDLYVNGQRNDKSYFYYENGKIKKVIPYLNDKKQGVGFEYDKKGNIVTITRYRNNEIIVQENINRYSTKGDKDGVWKEFYINGNIKEEKTYLNGKLNGYFKLYNEEGKLIDAIKYNNGEVDINSNDFETEIEIKEKYDETENLNFQGSYKKSVPIGVHRYFDSKGNVTKCKTYNITGNIVAEGIVLINGKEEGEWIYFYENNKKRATGKFNKGKKQGNWTYYYSNGCIQQTGTYTNGKLTGIWKWYYESGELLKEEFYIYGQLDGEANEYTELGNIISKGNYIEGNKEGEWIYRIGDQEYKGKYVMDFKDGVWKSYYLGKEILSSEGRFIHGNPDGKHEYFYPDGKLKEEKYYSEGRKVKSWSKYDEYGDLVLVVQYKEGKVYKINGVKVKLSVDEN
ncbi:MAG: hypothetical protein KAQ75_04500 [Bacteroidales bacterium]|nr:hypothetical protein [Bacteroidales bacterium]